MLGRTTPTGLIAGWLAGMAMGGRGFGVLGNIVVGVLIGGFLGSTFFGWDVTGFNVGSIVLAFLGAIVLLLIVRPIPGRQPFERSVRCRGHHLHRRGTCVGGFLFVVLSRPRSAQSRLTGTRRLPLPSRNGV
jgi:uncharacterized membrane protein YeaQ/YmgE (transglycosylase-associated protein family)